MNDESTLREYFASLRHAEEASVPSFERVIGRVRRRPNLGIRVLAVAASFAAMAVILFWVSKPPGSLTNHAPAPMLADWRAPTDFLLDTPGRELLNTIPEMGRYPSAPGTSSHTPTITPATRAGRERS